MSALDRAILRWRAEAWRIMGDSAAPWSLRLLAHRFLHQHGLV